MSTDELFHYTNAAGIYGISGSNADSTDERRVTFWANNARTMNDKAERSYFLNMLLDRLNQKDLKEHERASLFRQVLSGEAAANYIALPNLYIACFSAAGDLLSQWRGYTRYNTGFMIHLSRTLLKDSLQRGQLLQCAYPEKLDDVDLSGIDDLLAGAPESNYYLSRYYGVNPDDPFDPGPGSHRDVYPVESQMSTAVPKAMELIASGKHPSFQEEREWRIIAHATPSDSNIFVRPTDHGLVDHVNISLPTAVVTGVTVGPGTEQDHQMEVARRLFPGLPEEAFHKSECTYRVVARE